MLMQFLILTGLGHQLHLLLQQLLLLLAVLPLVIQH
jgi:hypothetical protein